MRAPSFAILILVLWGTAAAVAPASGGDLAAEWSAGASSTTSISSLRQGKEEEVIDDHASASSASSASTPIPTLTPTPAPTKPLLLPEDVDPQFEGGPGDEDVEWVSETELRRRIAEAALLPKTPLEAERRAHVEAKRKLLESMDAAAGRGGGGASSGSSGSRGGDAGSQAQAQAALPKEEGAAADVSPSPRTAAAASSPSGKLSSMAVLGASGEVRSSSGRSLQDTTDGVDATPTPTPGPEYPVNPDDLPIAEDEFGVPITFKEPAVNRSVDTRPRIPAPYEIGCDFEEAAKCPARLSKCLGNDAESRDAACNCFNDNGKCYRAIGCLEQLPKSVVDFCFRRFFCPTDMCEGAGASTAGVAGVVVAGLVVAVLRLTLA